MKDQKEEWQALCKQAAVEQDSAKLLDLVERINQLLEAKGRRLQDRTPKARDAKHGKARV